jgi:hypothetical protein
MSMTESVTIVGMSSEALRRVGEEIPPRRV